MQNPGSRNTCFTGITGKSTLLHLLFIFPLICSSSAILFLVWKDGEQKGVFCIVVDLAPMINRFVFPMSMGNYGTGRFLNQDGVILFDDNIFNIGRKFSDITGQDSGILENFKKKYIKQSHGTGGAFYSG